MQTVLCYACAKVHPPTAGMSLVRVIEKLEAVVGGCIERTMEQRPPSLLFSIFCYYGCGTYIMQEQCEMHVLVV